MTFYKIGEVARLLGLTTQALRFYEQEGVVTPKKSENGTRYYDEDQLILLLSFKKYRQADFSVQDIVTHFKDDHLSGLREQILAQREALLKQSELLRRRADALDAFEKRLAYAQAHLDEPAICDRPPLRLLRPSLSELSAADMESRRSLDAFIAAMPDTRISFARALAPKSEKHFRLCADEAACAAWALPLEHTASLPSTRCVRVIHRFACQPWDDEAVPEILACAEGGACGARGRRAVRPASRVGDKRRESVSLRSGLSADLIANSNASFTMK